MSDEQGEPQEAERATVDVTAPEGLTCAGRHYEQGEQITVARHVADDIVAAAAGRIVG